MYFKGIRELKPNDFLAPYLDYLHYQLLIRDDKVANPKEKYSCQHKHWHLWNTRFSLSHSLLTQNTSPEEDGKSQCESVDSERVKSWLGKQRHSFKDLVRKSNFCFPFSQPRKLLSAAFKCHLSSSQIGQSLLACGSCILFVNHTLK